MSADAHEPEPREETAAPNTLVVDAMPTGDPPAPPGADHERGHGAAFVPALAEGARVVLARPRILLFLLLLSVVMPLVAVLPVYESVQTHLSDATAAPGEGSADFLDGAPAWMLREWSARDPLGAVAGGHALVPLILASSLLGLLISAGWMSFAVRDRRAHGLASFLRSGGRWFFPFLRTWLLGLPLFFGLTWVFWSTPADWLFEQMMPDGDPRRAPSENTGRWLENLRVILYVWGLLKLEIWLDLARASLIVGNRTSALLAMARGFGFFLRRPFGVLGLVLLGLGIELLWIAGIHAVGLPILAVIVLLPLGRIVMRGARHAGLASFYETTVNRPIPTKPPSPHHHGDRGAEWG